MNLIALKYFFLIQKQNLLKKKKRLIDNVSTIIKSLKYRNILNQKSV